MSPWQTISGFELLHPLGGGPLTQVVAARRRADNAPCAIKLPRADWDIQSDAVRLLRREVEALQFVRHLHVVRLLDSQFVSSPNFLVLEMLTGESLRDRLQHDCRLEQRTALWIARQIAEGLQAVHNAGFVHGDVKPENVQLVTSGRTVLLDLGFAHRPNEAGSMEDEGFLLGTANYLAPERAGKPATDDFAADWFSFGVMLHEMLTGELPHSPRTLGVLWNLSSVIPVSVPANIRNWPERLVELVTGMLNRSSSARPRGPSIIHELIALEIAALSHRKVG